jgi:hypothetical protein
MGVRGDAFQEQVSLRVGLFCLVEETVLQNHASQVRIDGLLYTAKGNCVAKTYSLRKGRWAVLRRQRELCWLSRKSR